MGTKSQTDSRLSECVFSLTDKHSLGIVSFVARLKDIVGGLARRTSRQSVDLSKALEEQRMLLEACERLRDLSAWLNPQQESWRIGTALLLNVRQKDSGADAEFEHLTKEPELHSTAGPYISAEDTDLSRYPLWKIIREIIRQAVDIRVYELQDHLKAFSVDTTRSAIESALLTHRDEFRITRHGREKFVSLKGVDDAPATTRKRSK
jgi:hypothetical protein